MRRIKLIGCLTLAVGFMMISVGITIQSENSIAKSGNMKVQEFDIKDIANSEADYFEKLISSGTWLLEERVIQRKEMGCFNESSVNTVRCMTFKTRDGIVVPYCFMRTGRNGAFVDNGGSGGLLMGIDVTNGVVDTDALDEYGVKYETHPDSGIAFKGFVIPEWGELLAICKNAAE